MTLPLIMPGVLAAALLAFALSIDDFVITNFNSGSTITFPLFIWGAARVAIQPQIYVIATMIFLVTVAAMILTVWQQRRAEKMAAVRPDDAELVPRSRRRLEARELIAREREALRATAIRARASCTSGARGSLLGRRADELDDDVGRAAIPLYLARGDGRAA